MKTRMDAAARRTKEAQEMAPYRRNESMKNKIKPQAAKLCECPRRRDLMHRQGCSKYGTPNWLTPSGVEAPDIRAAEVAVIDMLAKSRQRKARRLIEVLRIIADANLESTVLGLKQMARAALRAAGEAV